MNVENPAESQITMIRRAAERAAGVWQRCIKGMQIERYKREARYSRGQREHNADPEISENSRANRRERHNRVYLMDGPFRPPWETVFEVFWKRWQKEREGVQGVNREKNISMGSSPLGGINWWEGKENDSEEYVSTWTKSLFLMFFFYVHLLCTASARAPLESLNGILLLERYEELVRFHCCRGKAVEALVLLNRKFVLRLENIAGDL